MAHIQDRWYSEKIDPDTGEPVLDSKGRPVKQKTSFYGKGMRYKVRYIDPDDKERSKSFPDRKLGAAQDFMHQMENDMTRGTYLDPDAGKIHFREFGETWLNSQTFEETTREGTEIRLRLHVYPYLGNQWLSAIKPSNIREWDRALQKKGLAETYRRLIFANVSAIFAAAIDDERLNKNPCTAKSVTAPRGEYPKIVPWVSERVHGVHGALPDRYKVTVPIGGGCGLRQGEVFGISPDDVDEDAEKLRVERQIKIVRGKLVFGLPKHGKTREVPLPGEVRLAIKEHVEQFPPLKVTLPWGGPDGEPVTVRLLLHTRESTAIHRMYFNRHVWKPALREAGVDEPVRADGFHALRHFYASVLLDAGENIRALAEYLGHADPAFTLRVYTHLMPSSAARTRSAIDHIFGGDAGV